jgi:hypothetical protein
VTGLDDAVAWVRDRWDAPPVKINSASVDDQSAWGAPPLSVAMLRWLEGADDTIAETVSTECEHFWTRQREGCEDCGGLGVKTITTRRFRFPMRAALARLRKHVHAAPGVVHPADFLYRLALADWNVEAACASVGLPEQRGEEQLLSAIHLCKARYGERPIGRPGRKSEAQSIAEAAIAA